MTIDALHGPVDRPRDQANAMPALGTPDANIFPCPRCTRPLAVGVARCGGCRTRLVAGVPLIKVSGFVALGLVVGLAVGGGLVGALILLARPMTAPTAAPPLAVAPSSIPGVRPGASEIVPASVAPAPSTVPMAPGVPPAALTALRQSTTVNQRLVADATFLAGAMAAADPSPAEIAPLLRNLAATAASGDRIAASIGTWDEGETFSRALADLYASIDRIAGDGLAASVTNERAYRDAGRRMLAVLDGVTDIDAAARRLAASVEVELPSLQPAS
jgi:hypothetical protein